jgi:5-methylthioadenosine/S-adenosylhomocysteine deaminase
LRQETAAIDLLIHGGHVLSATGAGAPVAKADVAVVGGIVAGVGDAAELRARLGSPAEELDITGRYLMPGIVNAHTHLFQSAFRGLGGGLRLEDWRARVLVPAYRVLTAEDAYWFSLLGALENVRSGVTSVVNFQAWPNDLEACEWTAEAIGEAGIRGTVVKAFGGVRYAGRTEDDDVIAGLDAAFTRLHGRHGGRVRMAAGPARPTYAAAETIREAHAVAQRHGSGLHTHVAETRESAAAAAASLGKSEVQFLYELGVLDPRFQAAHCVAVGIDDMRLLAETGATAIHCPISNMYLGSGIANVSHLAASGVRVALGTDGSASNNNQDMFAVMKTASLLQRARNEDASLLSADEVLVMAWRNGAVSCGIEAGAVAVGHVADLVVVDLGAVHNQPLHDALGAIVFSAHADDVETVIVGGRVIYRERQHLHCDEAMVIREAVRRTGALLARAGI